MQGFGKDVGQTQALNRGSATTWLACLSHGISCDDGDKVLYT